MKIAITLLLTYAMYLGTVLSGIWSIVEFLIYLVKDNPFNWWSIWMIIIFGVLGSLFFILGFILSVPDKNNASKQENTNTDSRFEQRLKAMNEKRNS